MGYRNGTAAQELVWRRPINSSHVIFSEAGHSIPQEVPRELGELFCFYSWRISTNTGRNNS